MLKLINNWIVTVIETVLLLVFAILTLVVDDMLGILIGVALIVYVALVVFPKVLAYRGVIQLIAIIEFFVITAFAVLLMLDKMTLFYDGNAVNLSIGAAMWFRATTEILHSYHGQGEGREQIKKFNAWKIFCYILLVSFGTFFAFTDVIGASRIQLIVACIAFAAAGVLGLLSLCNYRDWRKLHPRPPKPKKEKPVKAEEKVEVKPVEPEVVVLEEVNTPKSLPDNTKEPDTAVVEYIAPKK